MKKLRPSFIPAILWFIISVILLTLPGSAFPTEDWLGKIWFDKWVHIGMFSIMVTLWCWAILRSNSPIKPSLKNFISIAALFLGYGIVMEFVQKYFIPNRSFDVGDIIADAIGCVIGLCFSLRKFLPKQIYK